MTNFSDVINHKKNLEDIAFRIECKNRLQQDGVLVLDDFIQASALESIKQEGINNQCLAYYTANSHNIYLAPEDTNFPGEHSKNRKISYSKGCITTDQIPEDSLLHVAYNSEEFKSSLSAVWQNALA